MAVGTVHHGGCVYVVLFALNPWCLRKGVNSRLNIVVADNDADTNDVNEGGKAVTSKSRMIYLI